MPPTSASLATIIALARTGALDQARKLFDAADLERGPSAALALGVKGRLLKDEALRHVGAARQRLFRESASAYRRSAELEPRSYPIVNAATLFLLAGNEEEARQLSGWVLSLLEERPNEPETAYYHSATRAEALLLQRREVEARAAFAEAVALAPRAWEDHASTLRQFALILSAQGRDASWLDSHRPPRSLHFGGHMSFDPEVVRREHLDEKIAAVLEEENIGFGFGALAAGADIIIAEALLARGAELHAVLPGGVGAFAAVSVDPFGTAWRRRFDAVLAQAEAVRPVRPLDTPPDAAMIALADEVAMGAALMNGRRLETSAVQLLVLDSAAGTGNGASGRSLEIWAGGGWRQRVLTAPRETRRDASEPAAPPAEPLAVVAVGLDPQVPLQDALVQLHGLVANLPGPAFAPFLAEDRLIIAYSDPGEAAEAAVTLLRGGNASGIRIGGQYGPAATFQDPFSGTVRLAPAATAAAAGALASAPPGTACVTDDFAAALAAAGPRRPACEYIGELDPPDGGPPVGLYALKSYDQLFQPLGSDDRQ